MWCHCSPNLIQVGGLIEPPDARGTEPISWGANWRRAVAMGQGRTDRVFIYWADDDDPRSHIGRASWAMRDRYFYEVEPIGPLEDDPDRTALPGFKCCPAAEVIRCFFSPDMRSPYEG
jgi:hypothetical protein